MKNIKVLKIDSWQTENKDKDISLAAYLKKISSEKGLNDLQEDQFKIFEKFQEGNKISRLWIVFDMTDLNNPQIKQIFFETRSIFKFTKTNGWIGGYWSGDGFLLKTVRNDQESDLVMSDSESEFNLNNLVPQILEFSFVRPENRIDGAFYNDEYRD